MKAKLQMTRNYSQFSYAKENRAVDLLNLKPQHRKLRQSMQKYGFLPSFPIMVQSTNGKFIVKDGQHRLTFAREFGLDVYFVIDDTDIDIAEINQAQAGWSVRDYANRWANVGHTDYSKAVEFAEKYGIPVASGFAMLGGTIIFRNISQRFHDGKFRITGLETATRVSECYAQICALKRGMKHAHFLNALWACCHVDYFDEARVIETVKRRPELLSSSGTREAFLQMLEEIYNFSRRTRAPLRFDAEEAMRNKNPATKKA